MKFNKTDNQEVVDKNVAEIEEKDAGSHYCAVDGCRKLGGISGGGNFYCADHYRMQA